MIDERAIIDPSAKIAEDVVIGPWTIVGPEVEIGAGSWVGSHVIIKERTRIGKNNKIYPFATIGQDPQHRDFDNQATWLSIGDHNLFHEYMSVSRSKDEGGTTRIGNHNQFMAYVHIGHDCDVRNHTVISSHTSLSGHVLLKDYAILSGYSGIHQFCTVGENCFVAKATMVSKDVLPYLLVDGNPPKPYGLNLVGLQRRGFSAEVIKALKHAYRTVFRNGLTVQQAVAELELLMKEHQEVANFVDAINNAERGFVR